MKGNLHTQRGYSFRWLVWGDVCLIIVFFHRIATGVVADSLMSEFGVTGALATWERYIFMFTDNAIPSGPADTLV